MLFSSTAFKDTNQIGPNYLPFPLSHNKTIFHTFDGKPQKTSFYYYYYYLLQDFSLSLNCFLSNLTELKRKKKRKKGLSFH